MAKVEKVLLVAEVSPSREKVCQAHRVRGGWEVRGFVRDTVVQLPWRQGRTLSTRLAYEAEE